MSREEANVLADHLSQPAALAQQASKYEETVGGLTYLHLKQDSDTWKALTEVDKDFPTTLVPQGVELNNCKTATLLALGDMHATCDNIELAVPLALKLGSDLRYNETCEIYQQAQEKWPNEQ